MIRFLFADQLNGVGIVRALSHDFFRTLMLGVGHRNIREDHVPIVGQENLLVRLIVVEFVGILLFQSEMESHAPIVGQENLLVRGEVEEVQSLLKAGADVNAYDGLEDLSALHLAIHNPYIGHSEHHHSDYYGMEYPDPKRAAEIMKLLLDAKANTMVLIKDTSTPPLEWAAHNGKCDCVRLLLDGGAEIDEMVRGASALGAACGGQHTDIVKLLIERKADVNRRVEDGGILRLVEPLHDASGRGHADVVQLLVEAGADLMDLDICGRTPLECATANDELECAKILSGAMAAAEQRADVE